MGQIFSSEGDQEEAINSLIDALRWDATNAYAMLMMGNIFARHLDDIDTAMKYYDQALIVKPDDNITINNIGANLMQRGKVSEAKKYFKRAMEINPDYSNTHYALAMIAEMEGDFTGGFVSVIRAVKCNKAKDELYQHSVNLMLQLARKLVDLTNGRDIYESFKLQLEQNGNVPIQIVPDSEIPTAAKIEFSENHDREMHIVRFKQDYPAVEHLIMHELAHLKFVLDARKIEANQLIITTQKHKSDFIKGIAPTIQKLKKMGLPEQSIAKYVSDLFDGINRQMHNAPIDLFIEKYLHDNFDGLRPYQFLSLFNLMKEGVTAVTDKRITELTPLEVLSNSRIFNLLNALQFKDIYGIDLVKDFKPTASELQIARDLYDEYIEYSEDKEPAEEYELLAHWAKDLKLMHNFDIIDEKSFRSKVSNITDILDKIESDPFDIQGNDPVKEEEMKRFQESQKKIGTNMAVAMFMVDAMQKFDHMSVGQIREIAHEIALQGTLGYDPGKNNYRISAFPDTQFSGYHILAYYYVSFAIAIPDMLVKLELPYEEEYRLAKTLYSKNQP